MGRRSRAAFRKKVNATGRNDTRIGSLDRFALLPRWLWYSPQVSAMSPNARALLIELLLMYNGRNNGEIFLSVRDATGRLGLTDCHATLSAFHELEQVGLIEKTFVGFFTIKGGDKSRANAWRLTWLGEDGRPQFSDRWRMIEVSELAERARKRLERRQSVLDRYLKALKRGKFAVGDSATAQARTVEVFTTSVSRSVEKITALPATGSESDLRGPRQESATHILYHGDQCLPVEFIRAELSNFWRAHVDQRGAFCRDADLDLETIESAVEGSVIDLDAWERIRAALERVQVPAEEGRL